VIEVDNAEELALDANGFADRHPYGGNGTVDRGAQRQRRWCNLSALFAHSCQISKQIGLLADSAEVSCRIVTLHLSSLQAARRDCARFHEACGTTVLVLSVSEPVLRLR